MIIRALDSNNDWTFGKGKNNFYKKNDALGLSLKTRLRQWRGDCFFAPSEGVDYNNYLDIGTQVFLDSDIKRVILQTEGVLKILSYLSDLDRETRILSVQCDIETIFGRVSLADIEKTPAEEYETVNKTVPDGTYKITPDGLFKIVFVRKI